MNHLKLSLLVLALVAGMPGVCDAQVGLSTKPDYDAIDNAARIAEATKPRAGASQVGVGKTTGGEPGAQRMADGLAALQAKNFPLAETIFAEVLLGSPNNTDANFMMGVTEMSLRKWSAAKDYLEVAAKKNPKHPDPKSRLGVTYAKLGDVAGANAQRSELVDLSKACKGSCNLAPYILDGIQMIDSALQAGSDATPVSSPPPSPPAPLSAPSAPLSAPSAAPTPPRAAPTPAATLNAPPSGAGADVSKRPSSQADITEFIQRMQIGLLMKGYDPGPATGQLTEQTRAALKTFQKANGLAETGVPDQPTLGRLGLTP
jgi:tetratricopeptide (TPR) repeat protein